MISEVMEANQNLPIKNKGGRPRKKIRREEQLALMCTLIERKIIEGKAKIANRSVSEFLRVLALEGQVDRKIKLVPKEVVQLQTTLNRMAANLNQMASKNSREEPFSPTEKQEFKNLCEEVKRTSFRIKSFLK